MVIIYCSLLWCVWPVRQHSSSVTSIKSLGIGIFNHWHICHFDAARFNKLGLDTITTGEEPNPSNQVEEVHSYRPVQSEPLCSERIVHIDIGTAHSVAVTGDCCNSFNKMKKAPHLQGFRQFTLGFSSLEKGQCFTFGSNQHGQIGCSSRRSSRVPYQVPDLQGISMAACGDAFTLAIGSGECGLLMLSLCDVREVDYLMFHPFITERIVIWNAL